MGNGDKFDAVLFFSALADPTRLRLLNLMRNGEVCVCFFAETLGTNNPKISRHLSYLKRADLVAVRREGKWMHYRLTKPANETASEVLALLLKNFESDPQMQADYQKLLIVCGCDPNALVTISREKKSPA